MGSISVKDLRELLEYYPDDYEVVMKIRHKHPISEEVGEKGWIAYINGVGRNDDYREINLMN